MVNYYGSEEVTINGLIKLIGVKKLTCHCGAPLVGQNINHHKHQDGVRVQGVAKRQWVGVRCSKCGYNTALWKISVKLRSGKLEEAEYQVKES